MNPDGLQEWLGTAEFRATDTWWVHSDQWLERLN